ncbi:MAG: hypothetical protein HC837_09805 [Chloroflexaceae bacterium]|nr:hypothetical protein [Chloroflexaceae bacterium]
MQPSKQDYQEAILALISIDELIKSEPIIEEHRELLLTDEADQVFAELIQNYRYTEETVRKLTQARRLVQRCREVDMNTAFRELIERRLREEMVNQFERLLAKEPDKLAILQEKVQQAMQKDPDLQPLMTIQAWIMEPSWEAKRRYLESHPELLTDESDVRMSDLIAKMGQNAPLPTDTNFLQQHQTILRRSREVGIDAAFAELDATRSQREQVMAAIEVFASGGDMEQRQRIVEEQQALLLTDEADAIFGEMLTKVPHDDESRAVVAEHRELLRRCREIGIAEAFAELVPPMPYTQEVHDTVLAFLNAPSLEAKQQIAEREQARLLTDEADHVFLHFLHRHRDNPMASQMIQQNRKLIEGCREFGVEGAFLELRQPHRYDQNTSAAVLALINAHTSNEKRRVIETYKAQLTSPEAQIVFDDLIRQHEHKKDYGALHIIRLNRSLLQRSQEIGIDEALAEVLTIEPPGHQVGAAVMMLINTESLGEKELLIQEHRQILLTDEADFFFGQMLLQFEQDQRLKEMFARNQVLVRRCREVGIEMAIAEQRGS